MSKYRECVYMVLDEIKAISDDSIFTEEHVIFLLDKYRILLLEKKYKDNKDEISESNYQTICLDIEEVDAIDGTPCTGGTYMKSVQKIPDTLSIGTATVSPLDYYQGNITFISKERMRYVGHNKYLQNIIYCSIYDGYLYMTSANPQFRYLEKIKFTGIFEDSEKAAELSCEDKSSEEGSCDILDKEYPLEESLIPQCIELIVKELLGAEYRPKDDENNAADDLADLAYFIRRNTKNDLQKQISQ